MVYRIACRQLCFFFATRPIKVPPHNPTTHSICFDCPKVPPVDETISSKINPFISTTTTETVTSTVTSTEHHTYFATLSREELQESVHNYYDNHISNENHSFAFSQEKFIVMTSFLRSMVSKKKIRFKEEGFDLDLTYISERIIAMGYPSSGAEQFYRNSMNAVKEFFNTKHPNHYKIYNLCSEREYDHSNFGGCVERFPFDDHNAPPLHILLPFCQNVDTFLSKDPENVVAIHCKAGKGRTGTLIAIYLLHCGIAKSASEALDIFGRIRTLDGKGVTIPSQMRYVTYYENCLIQGFPVTNTVLRLQRIELTTTPRFDPDGGSDPYFIIDLPPSKMTCNYKMETIFNFKKKFKTKHYKGADLIVLDGFDIKLDGDVRIKFYDSDLLSADDHMFHFWFNTNFVDVTTKKLSISKNDLDKACKDKNNKSFDENFKVELFFTLEEMGTRKKENIVTVNCGALGESQAEQKEEEQP